MGEVVDARRDFEARQCGRIVQTIGELTVELTTREQWIVDLAAAEGQLHIAEEGSYE